MKTLTLICSIGVTIGVVSLFTWLFAKWFIASMAFKGLASIIAYTIWGAALLICIIITVSLAVTTYIASVDDVKYL